MLLILQLLLGLETQQVDYTKKTFYQAPLEHTIYVELPRGFESPTSVLLLLKLVYGLR